MGVPESWNTRSRTASGMMNLLEPWVNERAGTILQNCTGQIKRAFHLQWLPLEPKSPHGQFFPDSIREQIDLKVSCFEYVFVKDLPKKFSCVWAWLEWVTC